MAQAIVQVNYEHNIASTITHTISIIIIDYFNPALTMIRNYYNAPNVGDGLRIRATTSITTRYIFMHKITNTPWQTKKIVSQVSCCKLLISLLEVLKCGFHNTIYFMLTQYCAVLPALLYLTMIYFLLSGWELVCRRNWKKSCSVIWLSCPVNSTRKFA